MIDDGSKDDSSDIVDNFDNKGYKIWLMKIAGPQGVSYARNLGIKRAINLGADYITFLDADDELTPDAYEQITAAIAEAPDEEIIQLNHYRQKTESKYVKFFNSRGFYNLTDLPVFYVAVWNKIIKADILKEIEFKEGLDHGEDELFILNCLVKTRRLYCSERIAVTHHFDNPNSLSKSTSIGDLIDEQNALLYFINEHSDDREICEAVRKRQADLWTNPVYRRVIGVWP